MISGSIVAIVTPMTVSGEVDYDAYGRLLDWHIAEGTDAVVAVGTTGESATLTVAEHDDVIAFTVKHVNHRVPVIAGTGANATAEAIHLTKAAYESGADACLLVAPYYNKPPQEGLYQHYKAVAEAVPVPQILYNVPGRTACDISDEVVLRLARIDNIVGLKDATADVPRGLALIEQLKSVDGNFAVYSGEDHTSKQLMLGGGKGTISVTANVAPRLMHEMASAAIAGNQALADELDEKLAPLHKQLFAQPSPMPSKWALQQMGLIGPGIRLPLIPLAAEYHQQVEAAMAAAGVHLSRAA